LAGAAGGLEAAVKSKPAAFFEKGLERLITIGTFDDDIKLLADADWIIEAVAENLDIKRGLLKKVEAVRKPGSLITTNTSGLPVASIAEGFSEDFCRHWFGTHFFNPPRYMRLLEIIPTPETDPAAIETVAHFCDVRMGKGIVTAKDTPNFIANRIGTFAGLNVFRVMQEMDIAVAGDFLVMAATLIELKTRMLLPRDPLADQEEEEDPRTDLVNQLLEYQKYKAAAQMLWSRATVERAVFKRAELETDKNNPEVSVGLFDLLKVFQDFLARHKEEVMLEIERDEISMAEMLERLRNMVMSKSELNLRIFFERAKSRRELVLAFLSVLELVRTTEIRLFQRETFGDIIARVAN